VIYSKTLAGQAALQTRTVVLTSRQRAAFIMFDGKRGTEEILKMTAGIGVTQIDVDHLVDQGLLAGVAPAAKSASVSPDMSSARAENSPSSSPSPSLQAAPVGEPTSTMPSLDAQATYLRAYPVATRLTASLGLRGLRLNLAVEAAGDLQKLRELAPEIRKAVGPEKFLELENALR
jgi:hypothetical protein